MAQPHDHSLPPTRLPDLPAAVREQDWEIHYQPVALLETGAVVGVEALLRWRHPIAGLVLPDHFIPAAEASGLIRPLAGHVLDRVLRQAGAWRSEGIDLTASVNLSMRNLQDARLPEQVQAALERHGVEPHRLVLEITESAVSADPETATGVLARLASMGVHLALDDFGTGYSSLAHLRQLPVDQIKIDKSFVLNMAASERDAKIVSSTIDLGRSLGLEVVAEGVETRDAWSKLHGLGCHMAQGYFLSRPLPAPEILEWLRGRPTPSRGRSAGGAGASRPVPPPPRSGEVRVVVVDDHTLVRQSLVKLVGAQPEFRVVAEAGTAAEAVRAVTAHHPGLVVLDIELPDGSGLEVAQEVRRLVPETRILLLTMREDEGLIRRALELRIDGYVVKTATADELVHALRAIAAGGSYLTPGVAGTVMQMISRRGQNGRGERARLSAAESDVLRMLAAGGGVEEVAGRLLLSVQTVHAHLSSIYGKLGLPPAPRPGGDPLPPGPAAVGNGASGGPPAGRAFPNGSPNGEGPKSRSRGPKVPGKRRRFAHQPAEKDADLFIRSSPPAPEGGVR